MLKINHKKFLEFFGGWEGEPAAVLYGIALAMKNWKLMKLSVLQNMSEATISKLNYRSGAYYDRLKPNNFVVKEDSYLNIMKTKNQQRNLSRKVDDSILLKKQRNEALKRELLAPYQKPLNMNR